MATLPKLVCLKSVKNNKFLRYRNENVATHGILQFSGTDVMDSLAQFEVVESKCGCGLVHLKCRYNNLYMVRWSPTHFWIGASAFIPNENQSSWSCTLFKPVKVGTENVRLLHVQLDRFVRLPKDSSAPFVSCLLAESKEPDNQDSLDLLQVVDWESLFKLPKRVVFKSDYGGYLGPKLHNGKPCLQFAFENPKDPKLAHQIFTAADGTIQVKSEYYDKFWRIGDSNRIVADADGSNSSGLGAAMTCRLYPIGIDLVNLLCISPRTVFLRGYSYSNDELNYLAVVDWANNDLPGRLQVINLER